MSAEAVSQTLDWAASRLAQAGIDRPHHEARVLLTHSTGLSTARQIADPDHLLEPDMQREYEALIVRREKREPLSHLVGEREFWSLSFGVTSAVLDPRPDSETLIEAAQKIFPRTDAVCSVLDLGTGSGCLLLSVLSQWPKAYGIGVDMSSAALKIAATNADNLGLAERASFVCGDWGEPLLGSFDLILCNPPYIETGDLATLEPEVARYEPRTALDGGQDGLAAYRRLLPDIFRLLRADGTALVEIGAGQTTGVTAIAKNNELHVSQVYCDLSGIQRCLAISGQTSFTVT